MTIESIVNVLAVPGAIISFLFAVQQYRNAQRWKVLEFVAQAIKEFEDRKHVQDAMVMLDWNERDIELFPHATGPKRFLSVDDATIFAALDPDGNDFTEEQVAIRDTFDVFFTQLDRFGVFIQSGLVTYEHLHPYLRYWLELLSTGMDGTKKTAMFIERLHAFVTTFGYEGVLVLQSCWRAHAARPRRRNRTPRTRITP